MLFRSMNRFNVRLKVPLITHAHVYTDAHAHGLTHVSHYILNCSLERSYSDMRFQDTTFAREAQYVIMRMIMLMIMFMLVVVLVLLIVIVGIMRFENMGSEIV
jgi:hypothetical protein